VALVVLPSLLAAEAGGQKRVGLEAALRPLVNVYVDGVDARETGGLDAPLATGQTVRVVGAVAGG
jgi:molybdopterin converting factor small subunit